MHAILKKLLIGALLVFLAACADEKPGGERIRAFGEGMQWQPGFVSFYHDTRKGRVYLLLDASNRELIYKESLARGLGSNDIGLDRGQLRDRGALVSFEPAGDKVLLKKINLRYRADSSNEAERSAVEQAFASSVLWGFPVVARDGEERLVDATEFLLRDSHGVARRLKDRDEGSYAIDVSRSAVFAPRSKAFPRNTELEAQITLVGNDPGPQLRAVAPDPHAITVHTHHSFIALPEPGYAPRAFHPESGFSAVLYTDYAAPLTASMEKRLIRRHRLHKKNPEAALSDPVEPIVYYLDPGTPEPVRSALLEGAAWWADAFEAAGFSNAFRVEMLPAGADPMDVRYNVIQWVHRSTRGWSYGSSVLDPRTGEILKGIVTLGSLRVRQDLLIARGMTSPFFIEGVERGEGGESAEGGDEREAVELALARIRQLSAHEVGHTLGLAHNFAASVRERASVMDYPHPRMTLNEAGEVSLADAYAVGIGAWDKRAIRYGYAPFGDPVEEAEALAAHVAESREQGYEFISDPDSRSMSDFHPRAHLWDNGADAAAELERVMALRAVALERFGAASLPAGAPLSDLQEAIVPVFLFHRFQVEAAAKALGGVDYRYALNGDPDRPAATAVPAARQAAALDALLATLDPEALTLAPELLAQILPKAYGYRRSRESAPARTGALFDPLTLAEAAADHSLQALLHPERLARLSLQHALDERQLSPDGLFRRLQDYILLREFDGLAGAVDRRRAGLLLRHWRGLFGNATAAPDVRAAAHAALERARRLLRGRTRGADAYANFYRRELWLIERALQGLHPPTESEAPAMPPGSPIGGAA